MHMQMRFFSRAVLVCGAFLTAGYVGGCSSSAVYGGHEYTVAAPGSERQRVIEVVRGVLSDRRFVIDRVDARRGVVTTEFKSTQGIVSPWDGEQGSVNQEMADFVNQHERAVRVEIQDDGEIVVSVVVQRLHRPGWKIETESIAQSSRTTLIDAGGMRVPGQTATPIGLDGQLARRIGDEIYQRLLGDG